MQIQPALGSRVDEHQLHGLINHTIGNLKGMAEKGLPHAQASALRNAQLTPRNWADLHELLRGIMNHRVQEAGKIALNVIQDNLFMPQEVIAQRLMEELQPMARDLMGLRSKIVPERLDGTLSAWAEMHDESHGAWKGLLDPLALEHVHENPAPSARRLAGDSRRLDKSTTTKGNDKDNDKGNDKGNDKATTTITKGDTTSTTKTTTEKTTTEVTTTTSKSKPPPGTILIGISSVILVAAAEVLVHIEMFVPKFSMPAWAWRLILTPTEAGVVATCKRGLNVWCDIVLGALGLNVLDASYVIFCTKHFKGKTAGQCQRELDNLKSSVGVPVLTTTAGLPTIAGSMDAVALTTPAPTPAPLGGIFGR